MVQIVFYILGAVAYIIGAAMFCRVFLATRRDDETGVE